MKADSSSSKMRLESCLYHVPNKDMHLESFLHACPSKVAIISTKQKPNRHPSINLYMQANSIVFTVWLTIVTNKIQASIVRLKQSWGHYFKKVVSYIHITDYFQKKIASYSCT